MLKHFLTTQTNINQIRNDSSIESNVTNLLLTPNHLIDNTNIALDDLHYLC